MAGTLKTDIVQTDTIRPTSVSGTVTLGASGETISVPSGATFSATAGTMSGQNYPAFEANLSAAQLISDATITKVQFDNEEFDTDGAYDNSTNYRFTVPSGKAGKYFVYGCILLSETSNANSQIIYADALIYKNDSQWSQTYYDFSTNYPRYYSAQITTVMNLADGDYIDFRARMNNVNNTDTRISHSPKTSNFGAYRIGS